MFAELHTKSHYSFLTGASSPEELVYQAKVLGYCAIALTDECSYAGIVKAYQASLECDIKLIIGSEFRIAVDNGECRLLLLAPSRSAYSEISALITKGRRRSPKGEYSLALDDLQFGLRHCFAIWLPRIMQCSMQWSMPRNLPESESAKPESAEDYTTQQQLGSVLKRYFKQRLWLGVELFWQSEDQAYYHACASLSQALGINMVACNDVLMHDKSRQPLQDTITAIRLNTSIQALGTARQPNAEHYLKPLKVLQHQYPQALLEESVRIADLCHFSMDELRYEYPRELVPTDFTPSQYLRQLAYAGASKRWPDGVPKKVVASLEHELSVIQELAYEYYFLTVYDIVAFARSQDILCQGRGSAANSAVCYCLFITEVDPDSHQLLFERFISKERDEPPDIDVDFESQRREEVIQYIYQKYTRKRTALTATVITYRRKSAIRDVGKAFNLPLIFIQELNDSLAWWDKIDTLIERIQQHGIDFEQQMSQQFFTLVKEIMGTPRHLSQHVGGFLITESPTHTLVPIENAAMADRTIIQWDKYDIEILGLLKVDVLGLGMLSAIRRSLAMINHYQSPALTVQSIPREDPKVYDMLCQGDSIGVFQVESRAQISMLPRLKPRCFYDLVIEVAIVRPGPIQGDMVHPFLKRRSGEEAVSYPNDEIKAVLDRTLGVPVFQEQVIKLTMVAAGFSGGEADQLRRAMASWGKNGNLEQFRGKLIAGMLSRGHSQDFAERLFKQIKGFGSYGFPESHAASFALLVYISSWLKLHHPAAFYAGLLNSQPMGFYSPSQLIQDARRHGVEVLPICIQKSHWQHSLETVIAGAAGQPSAGQPIAGQPSAGQPSAGQPIAGQPSAGQQALRLGFCLVKGVSEESGLRIEQARKKRHFSSVSDVKARRLVNARELRKLVNANAFHQFDQNRRKTYWQSLAMEQPRFGRAYSEANGEAHSEKKNDNSSTAIKEMTALEEMLADYQSARGVSLQHHPMRLLRQQTPFVHCTRADQIVHKRHKSLVQVAGVVTGRQRPGTASGVIFMTLEDETGNINVVLWKRVQERFRQAILNSRILYIKGTVEFADRQKPNDTPVTHVIAAYIEAHDHALPALKARSRDFH